MEMKEFVRAALKKVDKKFATAAWIYAKKVTAMRRRCFSTGFGSN